MSNIPLPYQDTATTFDCGWRKPKDWIPSEFIDCRCFPSRYNSLHSPFHISCDLPVERWICPEQLGHPQDSLAAEPCCQLQPLADPLLPRHVHQQHHSDEAAKKRTLSPRTARASPARKVVTRMRKTNSSSGRESKRILLVFNSCLSFSELI